MVLSLPHLLLNISLLSAIGPQETPVDRRCVSLREDRGPRHRNSSLAPAFFIFGDSSVDVGTNNFLGTLARSDLPPYGRDFDTHKPTGRFCNGRLIVDYLALHMGLPFVPAFLGQSGEVHSMIHGVNYASSGAGILFTSGSDLGQHISLTQQIEQAVDTFQLITLSLGERRANRLFAESIFFLSVGSNDYIHHYLRNASGVKSLYLPWGFNQLLISTVKQRLKVLKRLLKHAVGLASTEAGSCASLLKWHAKMLPLMSGGISFILQMQSIPSLLITYGLDCMPICAIP